MPAGGCGSVMVSPPPLLFSPTYSARCSATRLRNSCRFSDVLSSRGSSQSNLLWQPPSTTIQCLSKPEMGQCLRLEVLMHREFLLLANCYDDAPATTGVDGLLDTEACLESRGQGETFS